MHARAKNLLDRVAESNDEERSRVCATQRGNLQPDDDFNDARLVDANLSSCSLTKLQFRKSDFSECTLKGTNFGHSNLSESVFRGGNAKDIVFNDATLIGVTFHSINLEDAHFEGSDLTGASFENCILKNAKFERAILTGVSMIAVEVDKNTNFNRPRNVDGFTIDRHTLACLGSDRGGLTMGNLSDMDVLDDVARLRKEFTGAKGWLLHGGAFVIFLAPYAWFLGKNWAVARFSEPSDTSISMFTALARFIFNGGANWEYEWNLSWSFFLFLAYVTFHALRISLLWKTSALETEQRVKEIPVKFSLGDSPKWNRCYLVVRWMSYAMIAVVLFNTIHFLTIRVPIPPLELP